MKRSLLVVFGTLIALGACTRHDDEYWPTSAKDIIAFDKIEPATVPADDLSYVAITVRIHNLSDTSDRNILFTTENGLFENKDTAITVSANSDGFALVRLKSRKEGNIKLRAVIRQYYIIDTTIPFTRAYPTDVLLTADKYVADTTDSIVLKVKLFREPGYGLATDPAKVFCTVTSLDTILNVIAPDFVFTENQQASLPVNNPYGITGRFIANIKTLKGEGDTIHKSLSFTIKK